MERVKLVLSSRKSTLKVYIPKTLFDKVCRRAKRRGITHKQYLKLVFERAVAKPK